MSVNAPTKEELSGMFKVQQEAQCGWRLDQRGRKGPNWREREVLGLMRERVSQGTQLCPKTKREP